MPETASPARASTSPLRGRITATPPTRPPSAAVAADCSDGRIVVFTDRPGTSATFAITRLPNRSSAPGLPARRAA